MRKKYRLELEIGLDESDVQMAIQIARSHFRKTGPASTPVNWNRINGKWRRITAEEFIPDGEIEIMELIEANDLLDAAGIEVTSVSCVEVRPEKTILEESSDSKKPLAPVIRKRFDRSAFADAGFVGPMAVNYSRYGQKAESSGELAPLVLEKGFRPD